MENQYRLTQMETTIKTACATTNYLACSILENWASGLSPSCLTGRVKFFLKAHCLSGFITISFVLKTLRIYYLLGLSWTRQLFEKCFPHWSVKRSSKRKYVTLWKQFCREANLDGRVSPSFLPGTLLAGAFLLLLLPVSSFALLWD